MDLSTAIFMANECHEKQTDRAGQPYILHPLRVMLQMETDEERIVAVLHDILEDTTCTITDLTRNGFSFKIIEAVVAITRNTDEEYEDFIERVLTNNLATRVKIKDLEDNMNILRFKVVYDRDLKRMEKYHKAWLKIKDRV